MTAAVRIEKDHGALVLAPCLWNVLERLRIATSNFRSFGFRENSVFLEFR